MIDPFDEIAALRKSHEELNQLIQKSLNQPPRWTIDSNAIAEQLSQRVPNPVDTLEQIKLTERNMIQVLHNFPKSIPIKGEFYGFTNRKTFFSYWGMLVLIVFVAFYVSFRQTDNEQIKDYKRLVEDFHRKNPKVANKYFGSWYERNIE